MSNDVLFYLNSNDETSISIKWVFLVEKLLQNERVNVVPLFYLPNYIFITSIINKSSQAATGQQNYNTYGAGNFWLIFYLLMTYSYIYQKHFKMTIFIKLVMNYHLFHYVLSLKSIFSNWFIFVHLYFFSNDTLSQWLFICKKNWRPLTVDCKFHCSAWTMFYKSVTKNI